MRLINATKVITYNIDDVRDSIAELNQIDIDDVSDSDAMELIYGWIIEDFGDSYGVVITDENGEEL